jgi:N-acetylmuramoyl-L-alanine amidase
MAILDRPSPNHGPRPGPGRVDMLILHSTGMATADAALERLCAPDAEVSAHYLVDEDGTVWRLVPEERRAWHAGHSAWGACRDVNSASIGIELVNPGHEFGYRPFPEAQMAAVEALCRGVLARHPIPPRHVLGHSDVAPQRKTDPGELFDWPRLARAGIGLWPEFGLVSANLVAEEEAVPRARAALKRIGYEVPPAGDAAAMGKLVTAFQRRYRPARCDGALDGETLARIERVAAAQP